MRIATALTAGLAVAAFLIAAPAARAEADGPDYYRVTGVAADDVLNVRAEPNARAAIVGTLAPDANGIRNLGCRGGLSLAEWQEASEAERRTAARRRWCRVAYRNFEGWAAGRYLAEGSAP